MPKAHSGKKSFHKTMMDDVRKSGFKRTLKQDFRDIYDFYIDKDSRKRLKTMGPFRRWIRIIYWILKSMILKLPPIRRVLLFISLYLTFCVLDIGGSADIHVNLNLKLWGFTLLLLILLLELKDKLLAQDELAAGRAVQKALMPEACPKFPGWDIWLYTQPANDVGGDLVDYILLDENRLGISIGDVSGKGLPAALFSTRLQATIRALAPTMKSITQLGAHMNNTFCRDCLPQFFASLIYLELSSANEVHYFNAGHMPPLIFMDNKIRELEHGGPALGIMPESDYLEQRIELDPGEMLCLYSDGVSEARNSAGAFFGEERLSDSLLSRAHESAEDIGKGILHDVETFIGEAPVSDDLSLVILKRTP